MSSVENTKLTLIGVEEDIAWHQTRKDVKHVSITLLMQWFCQHFWFSVKQWFSTFVWSQDPPSIFWISLVSMVSVRIPQFLTRNGGHFMDLLYNMQLRCAAVRLRSGPWSGISGEEDSANRKKFQNKCSGMYYKLCMKWLTFLVSKIVKCIKINGNRTNSENANFSLILKPFAVQPCYSIYLLMSIKQSDSPIGHKTDYTELENNLTTMPLPKVNILNKACDPLYWTLLCSDPPVENHWSNVKAYTEVESYEI